MLLSLPRTAPGRPTTSCFPESLSCTLLVSSNNQLLADSGLLSGLMCMPPHSSKHNSCWPVAQKLVNGSHGAESRRKRSVSEVTLVVAGTQTLSYESEMVVRSKRPPIISGGTSKCDTVWWQPLSQARARQRASERTSGRRMDQQRDGRLRAGNSWWLIHSF